MTRNKYKCYLNTHHPIKCDRNAFSILDCSLGLSKKTNLVEVYHIRH